MRILPTNRRWVELDRKTMFSQHGRGMEQVSFRLPSGEVHKYFVKRESPTVAIFAITTAQEVILVEQYRPGPLKVIRELPGGYIDKGETPMVAAHRELREETGYDGRLRHLLTYHDCAYSTRIRHCFLAMNCRRLRRHAVPSEKEGQLVHVAIEDFLATFMHDPMTDIACAFAALRALDSLGRKKRVALRKKKASLDERATP